MSRLNSPTLDSAEHRWFVERCNRQLTGKSLIKAIEADKQDDWLDGFATRLSDDLLLGRSARATGSMLRRRAAFLSHVASSWSAHLTLVTLIGHCAADVAGWMVAHRLDTSRWEALSGVLCRGVRTYAEVEALLAGGQAAGAYARWRTLVEVSAVAHVLAEGDEELSQRFLDHRAVQLEIVLSSLPASRDDAESRYRSEISKEAAAAIRKYGESFKHPLAWARPALGEAGGRELHRRLMSMAPQPPRDWDLRLAHAAVHVSAWSNHHYVEEGVGALLGSINGLHDPAWLSVDALPAIVTHSLAAYEDGTGDQVMLTWILASAFEFLCDEALADLNQLPAD
jgi:Family of unknown function (DUF5677)